MSILPRSEVHRDAQFLKVVGPMWPLLKSGATVRHIPRDGKPLARSPNTYG